MLKNVWYRRSLPYIEKVTENFSPVTRFPDPARH